MVQKYQALVYTVCHQLGPDVQEAQDLTQETFLAAWRAIDRCPSGFEKQWLARIAANKAKDYLQSAWNRRAVLPGDEGIPPGLAPPAEEVVLERAGADDIRAAVAELKEPYRPVCRLCLLEEKSPEEAALALGRPVKTIHTQLSRGKRLLRERLERSETHGNLST